MTPALEENDAERRQLRIALAMCLYAIYEEAMGGDGHSDEGWAALHAAAPLLGIELQPRPPAPDGSERVRQFPDVRSVLDALKSENGGLPQPPPKESHTRKLVIDGMRSAAAIGDASLVYAKAITALTIAWAQVDTLTVIPTVLLEDQVRQRW